MSCSQAKKGKFTALVFDNICVTSRFYRLSIDLKELARQAFLTASPGKFLELEVSGISLPFSSDISEELNDLSKRQVILRRPFSFCDVSEIQTEAGPTLRVEILYSIRGPGTLRMSTLRKNDQVSIIGPLGNGFSIPQGTKRAILTAGGMGTGPILHLAKTLRTEHPEIETAVLIGAKTAGELPVKLSSCENGEIIVTDDGSAGKSGFVTVHMQQLLKEQNSCPKETVIYACGPEPMLAEVARIAAGHDISCQVSMERMMACGIGLCQSCAVETRQAGAKETVYKLCCKDGPVFDSAEVIFSE